MTTMQPARLVPKGHVQAATSLSVTPPTGLPGDTVDALRSLDDVSRAPTQDELNGLAMLSASGLIQPPSLDGQLGFAYGVTNRFEVDGRIGASSSGAGFRVQLLRKRPGIYLSLGAMASFNYQRFPVEQLTDDVQVGSFRRQDFSFPLMLGYSRRHVHVWAGPKLMLSHFRVETTTCVDSARNECRSSLSASMNGRAAYLAGQVGIAVGSRRFWVALELSVARMWLSSQVEFDMAGRTSMANVGVSGRVLTPAVGLILWL